MPQTATPYYNKEKEVWNIPYSVYAAGKIKYSQANLDNLFAAQERSIIRVEPDPEELRLIQIEQQLDRIERKLNGGYILKNGIWQ